MTSSISSASSLLSSALFTKLDTRKQGYLEKADLETAMSSIDGSSSDDDSVDQLFTSMDADQDGKVTQDEMSSAIENVLGQLNQQLASAGMQAAAAPPPPPPAAAPVEDDGYTQDELTSIAADTKDDKLASLLTAVAANFDDADTDHDGKVSGQEAMAYKQSTEQSTAASSRTSSTSSASDLVIAQMQKLISAYTGNANQNGSMVSYAA
jgi:hypothetical protein